MPYGTANVDVIQSSVANTPVQFNDGNGAQVGTLCRAWVNFNGTGTVAIRGSFNVSSITDNGTGDYTINFTTALPDVNYAAVVSMGIGGSTTSSQMNSNNTTKNTSSFRVRFLNNLSNYDYDLCDVAIFR